MKKGNGQPPRKQPHEAYNYKVIGVEKVPPEVLDSIRRSLAPQDEWLSPDLPVFGTVVKGLGMVPAQAQLPTEMPASQRATLLGANFREMRPAVRSAARAIEGHDDIASKAGATGDQLRWLVGTDGKLVRLFIGSTHLESRFLQGRLVLGAVQKDVHDKVFAWYDRQLATLPEGDPKRSRIERVFAKAIADRERWQGYKLQQQQQNQAYEAHMKEAFDKLAADELVLETMYNLRWDLPVSDENMDQAAAHLEAQAPAPAPAKKSAKKNRRQGGR